jgi:drug/metabolite transporter (DMT)-like permease
MPDSSSSSPAPTTTGAPNAAPSRVLVVAAFAAVYLIWGSTYFGIAVAVETIPAFPMVALRQLAAGAILYTIMRLRGAVPPTAHEWRGALVGGVLLLVLGNGLVAWAEQRIASGVASLVVATTPLWITTFAALVPGGERPGPRAIGGMVLGSAGLLVLAGPEAFATLTGRGATGGADPVAIAALVAATIAWAAGTVLGRFVPRHTNAFMASAQQMLAAGVLLLVVTWLAGDLAAIDVDAISRRSWLAVAYLVAIGSLLGFTAFVWLLRVVRPSMVATYAYVNPIVALALGSWLGHEVLDARTAMAAAVVLAGVVLVVMPARPHAAATPAPPVRGAAGRPTPASGRG